MHKSVRYIPLYFLTALLLLVACERQDETECFPQRITRTILQGTNANAITSDYKYQDNRLDHIIFSNSQTHYFIYGDNGRLATVDMIDVKNFQENEYRMDYDGEGKLKRMDHYRMQLDRITQAALDTTYMGYSEFTYKGGWVSGKNAYSMDVGTGDLIHATRDSYSYDISGNITIHLSLDLVTGDTLVNDSMVYDRQRNLFSSLDLYFDGESHVNNLVEKTSLLSGEVYSYQILYSTSGFPDQVNIKLDGYLSEVIRVNYLCQ